MMLPYLSTGAAEMVSILGRHALAFARRHLPVFPLHSIHNGQCTCGTPDCPDAGKHPQAFLVPHGSRDATIDSETIRRWWHQSPLANIGVTLPFCVVIDRDDRNGGDISLAELQDRYGPLPRTWGALTGGGGEHAYYRLPDGPEIRGGNNKLGPGLDIKTGPGSYVVAPPSMHRSGVRYEWRADSHPCETPLTVAPPWLIKLLTPPPPPKPAPFRLRTDDDKRSADALRCVPSDDREVWVRIGMALHGHYGPSAFGLWDAWSRTSQKYDRKACERVWRSFGSAGGRPVGLGTIFYYAREYGRAA
jgi:hypothetical protein